MLSLTIFAFAILLTGSCDGRIVDLTHTLDADATKWPLEEVKTYFNMTVLQAKRYDAGFWLQYNFVEFYEHIGTHMDAPSHFGQGRQMMHEIPPEQLMGPGAIINIREKAAANPDYEVTVSDIKDHEKEFGRIPDHAIVSLNSGWSIKFPDPKQVFGSNEILNSSTFHFPGWSIDACRWLLAERQIKVLGTDTPSTDPGTSQTYPCHVHLQNHNIPLLEYVANQDNVPQNGTTIFLGPIKTRDGTGGACRILAVIPESTDNSRTNFAKHLNFSWKLICFLVFIRSAMTNMAQV